MTAIEKVLLRKDISSLIVAVVTGVAVAFFLLGITGPLATELTASEKFGGDPGFSALYIQPIVAFALQIVALELLLRAVIFARQLSYTKKK
jgi:hypothetical protein